MAKQPYLPPTLPLLPVQRPHVLYPFLQVHVPLTTDAVNSILATITEQADLHKTDPRDRIVAAVPVDDNDRRLGRWACGECDLWHYARLRMHSASLPFAAYKVTDFQRLASSEFTGTETSLTSICASWKDW